MTNQKEPAGSLVNIDNEIYYKIANSDLMRPFFMSIVSDSDHWMFISSNGGLTAGRRNAQSSLFPYYSDDKITEMAETTGSKSIFQVYVNGDCRIWEPFSIRQFGIYRTQNNLYKSIYGNKIVFEEINYDLGLVFRYQWSSSNQFGFVKKSTLLNISEHPKEVKVLDGIQNILPSNVSSDLQNGSSNLVDAYKKSELDEATGLGVYALSAVIVDKAEPSEALKANMVWSYGVNHPSYLLSSLQLDKFRKKGNVDQEIDVKAEKGAYFISTDILLEANQEKHWSLVANVDQSISDIVALKELIKNTQNIETLIAEDIDLGTKNLIKLTAAADGLQLSSDSLINIRHFSNTMFNIMRGGIFDNGYTIEKSDFKKYVNKANKLVFYEQEQVLENLPESFNLKYLQKLIADNSSSDFKRLCTEYLPLKFSRRHGDPSRPWNKFSINTRSEIDGSKILDYEGNWRDIFQNWEALAHSYPEFIEGMIHKFLNASTFDGYNPYRVTKDGFDWEVVEEHDPWSYIGYWGDHQIIYLLKFLEFIEAYYPGKLVDSLSKEIFVYANVPYKIKTYEDILKNPKDTISFDSELDRNIAKKRNELGADGALLADKSGGIIHVNLIEKLLATTLAKLSNFIPEAGIWLNTQRPEWNDANNALVGNGTSMVTLYYLYRFMTFLEGVIGNAKSTDIEISIELKEFFDDIHDVFVSNKAVLSDKISDADRRSILDALGNAGSTYRETIYENGFSNAKVSISFETLQSFINITKLHLAHSIEANRREDNMFHAYNLMTIENEKEVSVSHLSVMLEGQVAVLSAGYLSPSEALKLLNGLKQSDLFREDQYSYILYPNKELPRFDKKNNIPKKNVEQSQLMKQLIADGNKQIIDQDIIGDCHFNKNFHNAKSLEKALEGLDSKYDNLVKEEKKYLLQTFEEVFNHKSFTGRSGTFFGYEGLGSIYWHMVSKLLLAVQENCWLEINQQNSEADLGKLLDHYYEINAGIGVHKSPKLYGAFPIDPYSHTPATKGAQQPGMTGQVKEDVLSRFGELGVIVNNGKISFNPRLLRMNEFLDKSSVFNYVDVFQEEQQLSVASNTVCFTCCQVPVVYNLSEQDEIKVHYKNGKSVHFNAWTLSLEISKSIFERRGEITIVEVSIKK